MKKILVILPNNLGDVIMAIPVLQGLKAQYPGSHVAFFVESGFEAGIENSPFCDEIITFPRKSIRDSLNTAQWQEGIESCRSVVEQIARETFDLIINLCQHEFIAIMVPLMKGARVLGMYYMREGNHAIDDIWSQYLYAIPFSRKSNKLHAIDVYRRIAGVTQHSGKGDIVISKNEKEWAIACLNAKGIDLQGKIIVFQAGAAIGSKRWPVEHFIALGKLLVEKHWRILLAGAPSEREVSLCIQQGIGVNCFVFAGETSFRQSMALCSMAQGCVTGDTAQMHAAAGLGVCVYALFGPTNPVETGPYGNGHWVFSAYCPERPCFKNECATKICMRSILPQTVFACIIDKDPGPSPRCDVYRTALEKNSDMVLTPFASNRNSYFSPAAANAALKACGEKGEALPHDDEYAIMFGETGQWITIVDKMSTALESFLSTRNTAFVKEFERQKASLVGFKGIGEFWTALLNLRLNSIPLLDPLEGIRKSLERCRLTLQHIENAIAEP